MTIEDLRTSYLRQAAMWVAENQINQYRIDQVYPQITRTQNTVNMAGVSLISTVSIVATPNPYFRRVEVEVAATQDPKHILIKLNGSTSQY
jgi:general secretion pathway protein I